MSKENVSEFLKKVNTDKATAEKFKETFRASLVKAGKDAGFKFTREELDATLVEMKSAITEGEMKEVAAGGYEVCGPPGCCFPHRHQCFP